MSSGLVEINYIIGIVTNEKFKQNFDRSDLNQWGGHWLVGLFFASDIVESIYRSA